MLDLQNLFLFEESKQGVNNEEDACYSVLKYSTLTPDGLYDYENNKDISLNQFLLDNFNSTKKSFSSEEINEFKSNPYNECKQDTLNQGKDVFLISDFSLNNNTYSYECHIPKKSNKCEISGNFDFLFSPITNLLNNMFGTSESRDYSDICSNILTSLHDSSFNLYNNETSCIKYQINNNKSVVLPRNNKFILYKTKLIENPAIQNLEVRSFDYYNNLETGKLNLEKIDLDYNNNLNNLKDALIKDLCEKKDFTSFTNIKTTLLNNDEFYNNIFSNLDFLSRDISNLTLLTKYNTEYLKNIEQLIELERKKLKNIFGFDGANNGKLLDIKYMKNQKLQEIIIIILLLIFLIFFYSRKK